MNVFFPVARADSPMVHRLRVSCVSGPWSDGETCVRYIDVPPGASLYDLHEAIQDAVSFDGDRPFHFFLAEDPSDEEAREVVPGAVAGHAPDSLDECAVYEDEPALAALAAADAGRRLHYASSTPDGAWIFEIGSTGETLRPVPGLPYPGLAPELSLGPDPSQYGWPLDGAFDNPDDAPPVAPGPASAPQSEDESEAVIQAALEEIDGLR